MSQYSQESTCVGVSFLESYTPSVSNFIKNRLWNRCFPVNIGKFLRTAFSENIYEQLLPESRCPTFTK